MRGRAETKRSLKMSLSEAWKHRRVQTWLVGGGRRVDIDRRMDGSSNGSGGL